MSLTSVRLLAVAGLAAFVLSSCGTSSGHPSAPAAKLESAAGSAHGKIVVSALGAQRIGLQTSTVQGARGGAPAGVIVPYSSVVYDPSGQTYAFTQIAPLTYLEVSIHVARIDGNSAYLSSGPKVGAAVVSVGAEELFGVQTGVLAQT